MNTTAFEPFPYIFDRQCKLRNSLPDPPSDAALNDQQEVAVQVALQLQDGLDLAYVETIFKDHYIEGYHLGIWGALVCIFPRGWNDLTTTRFQLFQRSLEPATGGSFRLCERSEIDCYLPRHQPFVSASITQPAEIEPVTNKFRHHLTELDLDASTHNNHLFVFSELASNTAEHGQGGWLRVYHSNDQLVLMATDRGPGIGMKRLPNYLFHPGYTTVNGRRGTGYPAIIEHADRVCMSSDAKGTQCLVSLKLPSY